MRLWTSKDGDREVRRDESWNQLPGTYLHREGVVCSVKDSSYGLCHPALCDIFCHLCNPFDLGVHGADNGLFPLIKFVTHQSKAEGRWKKASVVFLTVEGSGLGCGLWGSGELLLSTAYSRPATCFPGTLPSANWDQQLDLPSSLLITQYRWDLNS